MANNAPMDPLDLTKAPPRAPRAPAGDLSTIFLARSIDKFRAAQPGGNLGAYQIDGFTVRMLDNLGLDREAFAAVVADAASDADVAAWVAARTTPETRAASDEKMQRRKVGDRINDADFLERYPHAKGLALDVPLIDMLEKDDAASFSQPS
jgi:hypothetical protein